MANQPTKYRKFVIGAASAALVATAVAPVASAAGFTDTKGNTHEEAINALVALKVIDGYADGSFKPNKTLTRSDVVKLMGKSLVALGKEIPKDARSNPRFTDLKTTSNGELLDYAAVVKDNGVFNGSNGRLLAGDNITRENMAVVLVRAYDTINGIDLVAYVNAQEDFKGDVKDLASAKSEARDAIKVLDFFDITNPSVANFNPKSTTTRGQFASFLFKASTTDFSKVTGVANAAVDSIKAVNATTVEVTFKDVVENVGTFTVEGLTVSNAAVKQTNNKVVVLTTTAQEGGKKYEVKLNDKAIGSFEGISAVIPTSIVLNTSNSQAKVGNQVTLSAFIGVKAAGVPVTFNVDAPTGSLNKDQVFEVVTDADGIASFSYTQYSPDADDITVYPTGAPQLRAFGTVYWGITDILAITEDKAGNVVANGTKKTYTVTYKDPKTGAALANKALNVSFIENTNVEYNAISKATVTNPATGVTVTPYQTKSNLVEEIKVTTDSNGQATFVVSGTNTAVTPYVFVDGSRSGLAFNNTGWGSGTDILNNLNKKWEATEVTATASKVVYEGAQLSNKITVERNGEEEAAAVYGTKLNGRDYSVTVLDKDGKPYANGLVNVGLDEVMDRILTTNSKAKFANVKDSTALYGFTNNDQQAKVKLDKDGKATFTLYGAKGEIGTPVVWIDQNTAENNQSGVLEEGEPSFKAPISNFQFERVIGALFTVEGETKDQNVSSDGIADYAFALTNQSGKALANLRGKLTYEVRNTSGEPILVNVPAGLYKKQDGTVVVNDGVSNRIEEYGSFTMTAIVANPTEAKFTVTTVANKNAGSVIVTPSFVTEAAFDASFDNGATLDVRDANKFVTAAGLTATFGAQDGVPSFAPNTKVEWSNLSKDTMKLVGHTGTIDYKKARFFVADVIRAAGPGVQAGALNVSQTYTETTLADFERYISGDDFVTFTKGADGAHTIRLEVNEITGSTTGPVAPTALTAVNQDVTYALTGGAQSINITSLVTPGNVAGLAFTGAMNNSDTSVATAATVGNNLVITPVGTATGTTTITVYVKGTNTAVVPVTVKVTTVAGKIQVNGVNGGAVVPYADAVPTKATLVLAAPTVTAAGTLVVNVNGTAVTTGNLAIGATPQQITDAINLAYAGANPGATIATLAAGDITITSPAAGAAAVLTATADATLAGNGIVPATAVGTLTPGTAGTATPAVYSFTLLDNVIAGQTVTVSISGTTKTFTAVAGAAAAGQFTVGATSAATAANLVAAFTGVNDFANYTEAVAIGSNVVTFTQVTATQTTPVDVLSATIN